MAGLQSQLGIGCNGVCIQYKIPTVVGVSKYANGGKRCNHCEIFIKWNGSRCPCCNTVLQIRPSDREHKSKSIPKSRYQ